MGYKDVRDAFPFGFRDESGEPEKIKEQCPRIYRDFLSSDSIMKLL